ncbi:uncharacterized protein LOC106637021 [Copidosoma floridanum]|uniref:uncharacterized protein LOC106637021 n=1 Tax=Copidosoma floridanum TaxID=29053 RepID=UPI0006C98B92|nr:uncharacterized protein LOC106637021 [Copidosoma floridanum]
MQDYIKLEHMTLVYGEQSDGYYLPHHAVIKPGSTTTKTRVVFDASNKTDKGISLNSQLMVGPTIQPKLFETLLRFRAHLFVMTADIKQMYRQILVHPDDRRFQRIFWYNNNQIETFELNTVTIGVASAPYLVIRTLHKLAEDEKLNFPLAFRILREDFYVDDLITGADPLENLLQARDELIKALLCEGFIIQKWNSNHPQVLRDLEDQGSRQNSCTVSQIYHINPEREHEIVQKTLGVA